MLLKLNKSQKNLIGILAVSIPAIFLFVQYHQNFIVHPRGLYLLTVFMTMLVGYFEVLLFGFEEKLFSCGKVFVVGFPVGIVVICSLMSLQPYTYMKRWSYWYLPRQIAFRWELVSSLPMWLIV